MFTVVPRETEVAHPPKTEIIDHNAPAKLQTPTWKKGKHSGNIPYDTLKDQRDKLVEAEKKYRARIRELEGENAELSKTYEATYQENKMLKGIIQHGPDASKVKELKKVEKEQKGTIDRLEEENDTLNKRLNEIEEVYNARGQTAESTWNELLAKLKQKRPRGEKVPTQGPFAGHTQANGITVYNQKQEMDDFDRHLDNLEKETQILLNKIRQLQSEKGQIRSAIDGEKGYITRNAAMNNALNEKLNRDLNQFALKLEKMKLKHKTAKTFAGMTGKIGHKHAFSFESPDPGDSVTLSPVMETMPSKTGYTPTAPPPNGKTIDLKSPKLNNILKLINMESPKLNNSPKAIEMNSPKLDKTIEMRTPKQFLNGKTPEADNLKPRPVMTSSKKQDLVNDNSLTDQHPKGDGQSRTNKVKQESPKLNKLNNIHKDSKAPVSGSSTENKNSLTDQRPKADKLHTNKVKQETPKLNKANDTHRDGKAPVSGSSAETNNTTAKSLNNSNGQRGKFVKNEKQTVTTSSTEGITNSENQAQVAMNTILKKTTDSKGKRNVPNGMIDEIKTEAKSGDVNIDNANKNRNETISVKQPVSGKIMETNDTESVVHAKDFLKNINGSATGGRYTHGPEPIPRKFIDPEKKTYRYSDMYSKRKENFDKANENNTDNNTNYDESGIKLNFTDKARYATVKINSEPRSMYKYGFPVRKNSRHIEDDVPNDAVLTYLRNRPKMDEATFTFKNEYADAKDKGSPSPLPLVFNDDAKTVGSDEIKFILTAKRPSYGSVYA